MTNDEILLLAEQSVNKLCVIAVTNDDLVAFARAVAAKEREACVKVCEDLSKMFSSGDEYMDGVLDCIDAIKARGE